MSLTEKLLGAHGVLQLGLRPLELFPRLDHAIPQSAWFIARLLRLRADHLLKHGSQPAAGNGRLDKHPADDHGRGDRLAFGVFFGRRGPWLWHRHRLWHRLRLWLW
jgi:hypothetical protein